MDLSKIKTGGIGTGMSGMHMNARRFMAILSLAVTAGCASSQGLHPEQLRHTLAQDDARFVGAQASQPSAAKPSRTTAPSLGLYVKPTGFLQHEFEWSDHDREAVLAWAQRLKAGGAAASTGFVPQSSLKGDTLAELRASASRYGADLLVIFDGAAAVDRYNNYKGPLLYWTILGAYFADGTQIDALCLVRGSVWDVKTGTLLFSENAEGRSQTVGPAALVNDGQVVLKARQAALENLLDLVEQKLRDVTPPPGTKPR